MRHDTPRDAPRTFGLGHVSAPYLTDEKYLGSSLSVMKDDGDYKIVIELDPWATDIVRGRQWHARQQITNLPAGGSHLSLQPSGLEEIEQPVLSWDIHATVIRPEALADAIRRIATALVQRYAPCSP
ncbi:MAG: WYL domain-containing protein [Verrucomicrobia bacterium]|nr:WYL domain-containing protein [Verrucomicrobiota bacterium]